MGFGFELVMEFYDVGVVALLQDTSLPFQHLFLGKGQFERLDNFNGDRLVSFFVFAPEYAGVVATPNALQFYVEVLYCGGAEIY